MHWSSVSTITENTLASAEEAFSSAFVLISRTHGCRRRTYISPLSKKKKSGGLTGAYIKLEETKNSRCAFWQASYILRPPPYIAEVEIQMQPNRQLKISFCFLTLR